MKSAEFAHEMGERLGIHEMAEHIESVERSMEVTVSAESKGLRDATLEAIHSGGRRLRPNLLIASAACQGYRIDEKIIDAAAAVEFVQIASLVIDDAMDRAKTRHGVETIYSRHGVIAAFTTGGSIQNLASVKATRVNQEVAAIVPDIIDIMYDGQFLEEEQKYNPRRSVEAYETVTDKKTAGFMAGSCEIGGQLAGMPPEEVNQLKSFGMSFGRVYQGVDDILNFTSTEELMGKPVGNDIMNGVYTLPVLLARDGKAGKSIAAKTNLWLDGRPKTATEANEIARTLVDCGAIAMAIDAAKQHAAAAAESLKGFPDNKAVRGLMRLPGDFIQEMLEKQVIAA